MNSTSGVKPSQIANPEH